MDKELLYLLREKNIMDSGITEKITGLVLKYGKMEENILELLKRISRTVKELLHLLREKNMLANIKMVKGTAKEP